MFSVLRNRFGIPGVISVIALIFALTGSAIAAKYIITSTNQIKPSVLKKLKGAKGAQGAVGPAGPAGAQGPAGPAGKDGAQGKQGEPGPAGADGADGQDGSPWTVGNVLPPGASLTGDWAVSGKYPGLMPALAPISFPIPLSEADAAEISTEEEDEFENPIYPNIHVLAVGEDKTTDCPGTLGNPEAAPGELCVYRARAGGFTFPPVVTPAAEWTKSSEEVLGEGAQGVDTSGAVIFGIRFTEGNVEEVGTWAVTAPEE